VTSTASALDNYFMYMGTDGVYSHTFQYEKRKSCPVCGGEAMPIELNPDITLDGLIELLVDKPGVYVPCT
jgi:ubiquitin-activating enzyme E1 C